MRVSVSAQSRSSIYDLKSPAALKLIFSIRMRRLQNRKRPYVTGTGTGFSTRFPLVKPKTQSEDLYDPVEDLTSAISLVFECKDSFYVHCFTTIIQACSADFLLPSPSIEAIKREFDREHESIDALQKVLNRLNSELRTRPSFWAPSFYDSLPKSIVVHIMNQAYWRSAALHTAQLRDYKAASDAVYGELMPALIYDMFSRVGLACDSVFVDIGCGIGNAVAQASLQTGCTSYGIEMQHHTWLLGIGTFFPAFLECCHLWGFNPKPMSPIHGDATTNEEIPTLLKQADVVLVNNRGFSRKSEYFPIPGSFQLQFTF